MGAFTAIQHQAKFDANGKTSLTGVSGSVGTNDVNGTSEIVRIGANPATGAMYVEVTAGGAGGGGTFVNISTGSQQTLGTVANLNNGTVRISVGTVGGASASGAASSGNPVIIAGTDAGGTVYAPIVNATSKGLGVSLVDKLQGIISGAENDNVGVLPVRRADAFQSQVSSADASGTVAVKAATAAKSIYITDLNLSVNTAMNVKFQDGTAAILIPTMYLPGSATWSKSFITPIKVPGTDAFNVVSSASGSITIVAAGYVI